MIVRKGEIACNKEFFLFSQCFPQLYILSTSKLGIVWKWVKAKVISWWSITYPSVLWLFHTINNTTFLSKPIYYFSLIHQRLEEINSQREPVTWFADLLY